jgi:hypothetical protein
MNLQIKSFEYTQYFILLDILNNNTFSLAIDVFKEIVLK